MARQKAAAEGHAVASLETYRSKRREGETPEPFGGEPSPGAPKHAPGSSGLFVVQLHDARNLHFDLRLEMAGVLRSWAVPKGPSLDPQERRLAVLTEDHPLEYAEFEGVIPTGNYGAGAMVVWDRGLAVHHLDPLEGFTQGKLLFELRGYKLHGLWTLVRTRRGKTSRDDPGDDGRQWLLIKKPDGWATGEDGGDPTEIDPASVLSGLTVEELAQGSDRAEEIHGRLDDLKAPAARDREKQLRVQAVRPMLAERAAEPFSRPGWIFELKYDGHRLLAGTGTAATGEAPVLGGRAPGRAVTLRTRSGRVVTGIFPEISRALAALPYESLILDGELVILDEQGVPSFSRLQRRALRSRTPPTRSPAADRRALREALTDPALYQVFDLLAFEGRDLRALPLAERIALLRQVLPASGPLRVTDHVEERGEALFAQVEARGLEGLVAKRLDASYQSKRSPDWLKIRAGQVGTFAVLAYVPGKKTGKAPSEPGVEALHLGVRAPDDEPSGDATWAWVACVDAGLTAHSRRQLAEALAPLRLPKGTEPPLAGRRPGGRKVWVEPQLLVKVRFTEVQGGSAQGGKGDPSTPGTLRHPLYLEMVEGTDGASERGLLDPARAQVWTLESLSQAHHRSEDREELPEPESLEELEDGDEEEAGTAPSPTSPAPTPPPARPRSRSRLRLTNLDKIYWPAQPPDPAITKGELLAYYRAIAPALLPYLHRRPIALDRYPDGIDGKSFFQKHAPDTTPDWVSTAILGPSDEEENDEAGKRVFVGDDLDTLLYLVNLGSIPLHITASTADSADRPDWTILDLDAKDAPFDAVLAVARAAHRLCQDLELPHYLKTSGATGLHILLPLGRQVSHLQARQLAELLARLLAQELPERASVARMPAARPGKVYVDFLQNGRGKLLVAPYSVRPRPGAPVSTPLFWEELTDDLDPREFHMGTVPERLEALAGEGRDDPWGGILEERPDLGQALGRLAGRLGP